MRRMPSPHGSGARLRNSLFCAEAAFAMGRARGIFQKDYSSPPPARAVRTGLDLYCGNLLGSLEGKSVKVWDFLPGVSRSHLSPRSASSKSSTSLCVCVCVCVCVPTVRGSSGFCSRLADLGYDFLDSPVSPDFRGALSSANAVL